MSYFTQLLIGLQYLHAKNIAHRDLKPANILVFEKNLKFILKIADFGLSKRYDPSKAMDYETKGF